MAKRYFGIIIVYVICQASGFLAYTPVLDFIPKTQRVGFMITTSFVVCLILSLIFLLPELHTRNHPPMATSSIVNWCIAGIFMVYVMQIIAGIVDLNLFGGSPQSQNTEDIMNLARKSPYVIVAVVLIGPMLEEIIFRKVIFGSLNKVMNFWFAAIISSLLFAVAHADGHLIIYGSIGLVLAYLYKKTGRIYVSMIAHGSLNAIATLLSLSPLIQHVLKNGPSSWIGWWF